MLTLPARDKLLHYAAGSMAAVIGVILAVWLGVPASAGGVGAALLAGCAREAYNSVVGGDVSLEDVLWTVAGSGPVVLAVVLAAH